MKRKLLCGLLAAASLSVSAQAARTVPVQVDGKLLPGTARLDQGVTYAPCARCWIPSAAGKYAGTAGPGQR
ncbi:hypothetical protein [Oscillibacter sp.]|uniref:hypothetical protein n=1 Tax=Oscillibacter sp. TaxID=1945593 RepID=UPI00263351AC|nr:hypothetical protein [Oscillibacter sp.]MDD3347160.1 hypothetical protein [Oscillibacter sp.]